MCEKEFSDMVKFGSLSWISRFKWFGTEEFVKTRVQDGHFNNSKFVGDRYNRLVRFEISDESVKHFTKCGHREFMLDRRKAPMIKIESMKEVL
jgi:hypothetical protein